jgi:hypothetical protein
VTTALMQTPWHRRYKVLAPNERKNFRALIDSWAMMSENRLRALLSEEDEEAA